MSISDLFDSGFRNKNKGHFSAIVRVALSDGIIGPEEKYFLDKLAIKLEISQAEYEEILENPLKYPVNPPLLHTHRLERLYDLSRMVYADEHVLGKKEHELLKKIRFGTRLYSWKRRLYCRQSFKISRYECGFRHIHLRNATHEQII